MKTPQRFYPIGTPGLPWGAAELAQWRARQRRQRSYAEDVQRRVEALRHRFDVQLYGTVTYADERFELLCVRSRNWARNRPAVLVTGGVHGYETSGVHGALRFAAREAARMSESSKEALFTELHLGAPGVTDAQLTSCTMGWKGSARSLARTAGISAGIRASW